MQKHDSCQIRSVRKMVLVLALCVFVPHTDSCGLCTAQTLALLFTFQCSVMQEENRLILGAQVCIQIWQGSTDQSSSVKVYQLLLTSSVFIDQFIHSLQFLGQGQGYALRVLWLQALTCSLACAHWNGNMRVQILRKANQLHKVLLLKLRVCTLWRQVRTFSSPSLMCGNLFLFFWTVASLLLFVEMLAEISFLAKETWFNVRSRW